MAASVPSVQAKALGIFKGLSQSYDKVVDYATFAQDRRWKAWAIREGGLTSGSSVLDLGCGTCVLEERLRTNCDVVGVDLTERMIRVGQRKPRRQTAMALLVSDGQRLPFRDATFDTVISCYVVKYCNPKTLAAEVHRVLRPGGRFVLYDFVRPGGTLWPLNAIYVHGGLRLAGRLLEMGRIENAYTFSALPGIIESRPWELNFRNVLEEVGYASIASTSLSGGAALGFTARRFQ